jgi:hypothetical protein
MLYVANLGVALALRRKTVVMVDFGIGAFANRSPRFSWRRTSTGSSSFPVTAFIKSRIQQGIAALAMVLTLGILAGLLTAFPVAQPGIPSLVASRARSRHPMRVSRRHAWAPRGYAFHG